MTWSATAPYVAESKKICWIAAPYLRGRGVDLGAGTFKVLPHAMSVDNGHHEAFGMHINPDVRIEDAQDLSIFGSQSMDFVYSSHLLEHIENPQKALKEWWRILRVKGYLVLYLPHDELYPKVGEPGANPDHKHNLNEKLVEGWMQELGGWDLVECQKRAQDDEYSFFMVFRKLDGKRQSRSYADPRPAKTACVVRYGAFGDLMQSSSVWAALKAEGFHVTVFSSLPGAAVIEHDPNIDKLVLFDKDQVPNANLVDFWNAHKPLYDRWVNLSESVEGTFLAMPGRTAHGWSPMMRHKRMNENYVAFQHELGGVEGHAPAVKFYATDEEKAWAKKTRAKMNAEFVVMWSLAGSSVHKTWPYLDNIVASFMVSVPESHVVLVGGPECVLLEQGWEQEPRVTRTCGKWSIRQSLAFLAECDLVIGPETGVLNASANMAVPKIVFLSHSTHENLTRDWVNVHPLASKATICPGRTEDVPACHQLHYGWDHCKQDKETGTAQCQADISGQEVWATVGKILKYHAKPLKKAA